MTNRIDENYRVFIFDQSKEGDIQAIREVLEGMNPPAPLTLENAQAVLRKGLAGAPDAWVITLAELPELWAEQVTT
jgi:hypothetical protein